MKPAPELSPKARAVRSLRQILETVEGDACDVRDFKADIALGAPNDREWNHVVEIRIETARVKA